MKQNGQTNEYEESYSYAHYWEKLLDKTMRALPWVALAFGAGVIVGKWMG